MSNDVKCSTSSLRIRTSEHFPQYLPTPYLPWIVHLWTKHISSQSQVDWLLFSASEDGFGATDGGAVCTACLQMVVYSVTHGELSHASLCPVDKGIDSCFSCLSVFIVCHNSDVLSLLKQFDTYPNSDFYKDNCPTSKCQAEHPCISAAIEVSTFFNISDAFKFHLLVSE